MKANVKGFIRNLVSDVLQELLDRECLYDKYGIAIDEYDNEFSEIKEITDEVTERWLDCIEEEKDNNNIINECIKFISKLGKLL